MSTKKNSFLNVSNLFARVFPFFTAVTILLILIKNIFSHDIENVMDDLFMPIGKFGYSWTYDLAIAIFILFVVILFFSSIITLIYPYSNGMTSFIMALLLSNSGAILVFSLPTHIWTYYIFHSRSDLLDSYKFYDNNLVLLGHLMLFIGSCIALISFSRRLKPKKLKTSFENDKLTHLRVSNLKRFLHLVLDSFVLLLIFVKVIAFKDTLEFRSNTLFFTLLVISAFLFYFLFECVFRRTPAKFLSRSSVAKIEGATAKAYHIALRTIIRFIPLEGITFLLDMDWHDKKSRTVVLEDEIIIKDN